MSAGRHLLSEARYRNERKRIIFEKWLKMGLVQFNFDATREDVAMPEHAKKDHDYWIACVEAEIYTSHVEGTCNPPRGKPFQFSVPWDAIHAMYSKAVHERHIWLEDVDRNAKRQEVRRMAKTGKALPS